MWKHLPSNVARFEQLMYLSIGIEISQFVLADGPANELKHPAFLLSLTIQYAGMASLTWLAARRRQDWARWFLLVETVLALIPLIPVLVLVARYNLVVAGLLWLADFLARAVAFFLSFTGDARGWFEAFGESRNWRPPFSSPS